MPQSLACVFASMSIDTCRHKFWKETDEKVCEDEMDIRGKIIIVTGSNTGVGKVTALQLAKRGAKVIMAVRNLEKGRAALEQIKEKLGVPVDIEVMKMDLGDLQCIRDFVEEFEKKYDHLDILVNNAATSDASGVKKLTKDGFEQHLGCNFLGSFLLTYLLLPSLKKGAPSRIVSVQSTAIVFPKLDLDVLKPDAPINNDQLNFMQYGISKLLSALVMRKLAREMLQGPEEVKLFQMCPGHVKTDLSINSTSSLSGVSRSVVDAMRNTNAVTPHEGCETVVYLCVSQNVWDGEDSGKGEMYRFKNIFGDGNKALKKWEKKESEKVEELYKQAQIFVGLSKEE